VITKFIIENFRSIEKAEIPLSKINILTGSNNSGKSSVIYALMSFRNFVSAPNSTTDAILNHDYINLGGWENCVFMKQKSKKIIFKIECEYKNNKVDYDLLIGEKDGATAILFPNDTRVFRTTFSLPYSGNKTQTISKVFGVSPNRSTLKWKWNGLVSKDFTEINEVLSLQKEIRTFLNGTNRHYRSLIATDVIPFDREFTQPIYNTVPLSNKITTKEEIATVLINDRTLQGKVSHYFEKIVAGKTFSISPVPGTHSFYLQVRDRESGLVTDLVNEGTGVNQVVTILTKTLYDKTKTICIDEPEIHLHPSMIEKLVEAIIEIADKEQKQFIISTHSEHFIQNILLNVIRKKLSPEDVNLFFLSKEKGRTSIEKQQINEQGQIEGGLKSFYQDEFKLYKELL
jgi:predicted ATPase